MDIFNNLIVDGGALYGECDAGRVVYTVQDVLWWEYVNRSKDRYYTKNPI